MTAPDAFSIGVARPVWKCRSDMMTMPADYGRKGAARLGGSVVRDLERRQPRTKLNRSAQGYDLGRFFKPPQLVRPSTAAVRERLQRRIFFDLAGIAKPVQRCIGIGDGQHW